MPPGESAHLPSPTIATGSRRRTGPAGSWAPARSHPDTHVARRRSAVLGRTTGLIRGLTGTSCVPTHTSWTSCTARTAGPLAMARTAVRPARQRRRRSTQKPPAKRRPSNASVPGCPRGGSTCSGPCSDIASTAGRSITASGKCRFHADVCQARLVNKAIAAGVLFTALPLFVRCDSDRSG
jgi:hypothetical protein